VEQEDLTRAIIAAIEVYARAHPGTTDEQVEDARLEAGTIRCQGQFGVRDNSAGTIRCQFVIIASLASIRGTIRGDNSVSGTIRCQFADNSVSVRGGTIRGGQFGVSSSLLLPLHQVGGQFGVRGTIRCQFVIIASLASSRQLGFMGRLPRPTGDDLIYHAINRGTIRCRDNSVSVRHGTIRCQFVIIASLASSR
jgi:hypothetical protein